MESPLYFIFLIGFCFLCVGSFFSELTYYVDQIYVFGFHLMNEFECEIQKLPLSKCIEAKHNEQYITAERKEKKSVKKKATNKRTHNLKTNFIRIQINEQQTNLLQPNIVYFVENLKFVCILHIIRCTLYTLCTRNDQDSWCTWSIWILDFYFIACKNKTKRMETIWNCILYLFWLYDWSTDETMLKRKIANWRKHGWRKGIT